MQSKGSADTLPLTATSACLYSLLRGIVQLVMSQRAGFHRYKLQRTFPEGWGNQERQKVGFWEISPESAEPLLGDVAQVNNREPLSERMRTRFLTELFSVSIYFSPFQNILNLRVDAQCLGSFFSRLLICLFFLFLLMQLDESMKALPIGNMASPRQDAPSSVLTLGGRRRREITAITDTHKPHTPGDGSDT